LPLEDVAVVDEPGGEPIDGMLGEICIEQTRVSPTRSAGSFGTGEGGGRIRTYL
jgi:hypothetical protein